MKHNCCNWHKIIALFLNSILINFLFAEDDDHVMKELGQGFGEMGDDLNSSLKQIAHDISSQNDNNQTLLYSVFILIAICLIILVVGVTIFVIQSKRNKKIREQQKEQFEATMNLIKELQTAPARPLLSTPQQQFIGQPTDSAEMERLQKLAEQCENLGEEIDEHTNRRNNSKNVSELVFKISQRLGVDRKTMMLYFCASMVYDAGFLSLPVDFFLVEILSAEERKKMKMHVNFAANYLTFIPKEYWTIFHEAVTMHHENMNGSGYPEGITGDDIPQISRIIHVVESYVSLVSKRSYHKMFDKEGAIAELRRLPGLYDGDIVDVLEKVV